MKIAYVSDQFLPQTATDTEQSLNMIAALGSQGARVQLVVPRGRDRPGPTSSELAAYYQVADNFEVVSAALPSAPRGLTKTLHAGRSVLRGLEDCDVIYTRNLPTVVAAALRGIGPVIYETYRPWPDQHQLLRTMLGWLARTNGIAGLVLHSELAADSFERVGFPRERLLVAHNAWDPAKLEPRLDQESARGQCDLPRHGSIVTYAGRIAAHKGIGLVLDIARALPEVHFVLVGSEGDGPMEREAATVPNVIVRPWLPFREVVPYLYASDVLLIPPTLAPLERTGTTVLPMKTFLYMATGRPIFAGVGPDIGEVLTDDVNACLVAPDDSSLAI
ncbi:MAG: glycosyltransferase, partial [Myxococcota bacterium]